MNYRFLAIFPEAQTSWEVSGAITRPILRRVLVVRAPKASFGSFLSHTIPGPEYSRSIATGRVYLVADLGGFLIKPKDAL